jgi:microcystin-dependent protein
MASPPFSINEAVPGDSDIVSQFPALERTFRDIVESWLLINHNNLGEHKYVTLPWTATVDVPAAIASKTILFADVNGSLKMLDSVRGEQFVIPPGTVIWSAGSALENGYLWPTGSNISRTTFAALFDRIGTTFGVGDGSTTFALPDIRARYIIGRDNLGGAGSTNRALATYSNGVSAAALGNTGGLYFLQIATSNVPAMTGSGSGSGSVTGSVNIGGLSFLGTNGGTSSATAGAGPTIVNTGQSSLGLVDGNASVSVSVNVNSGSPATPLNVMGPTIVLNPMIKY